MRGRWELLTAVVRGRCVRRSVREHLQVCTSALLYPNRPRIPTVIPIEARCAAFICAFGSSLYEGHARLGVYVCLSKFHVPVLCRLAAGTGYIFQSIRQRLLE